MCTFKSDSGFQLSTNLNKNFFSYDTGHHSSETIDLFMHVDSKNFHGNINGFLVTFSTNCHILLNPNFVACFVFLGMAFPFIKLISSSDTLTKRKVVILKICPPAIITSAEVIIAEYDAILGQ